MSDDRFLQFSKPFIDALKETFKLMVQTEISPNSPRIKDTAVANGDISAVIGMNGFVEAQDSKKTFKGLMVLSWPEDVYLKVASKMLFEEYTEYCEDISDSGAEICNIVMGNAKSVLSPKGFKIEMATPTVIRGTNHEIKYPPKSTVVSIKIDSELGDFFLELCYQEFLI